MPSCRKCGAYTKDYNGLCKTCYYGSSSKAGKEYFGEVKFKSGKKTIYTGQTKRSVYKRVKEHMNNQNLGNTNSYVGRGTGFRLLGSIFSNNRFKAEKTIKQLPRDKKISLARKGAKKFKKRYFWD